MMTLNARVSTDGRSLASQCDALKEGQRTGGRVVDVTEARPRDFSPALPPNTHQRPL